MYGGGGMAEGRFFVRLSVTLPYSVEKRVIMEVIDGLLEHQAKCCR